MTNELLISDYKNVHIKISKKYRTKFYRFFVFESKNFVFEKSKLNIYKQRVIDNFSRLIF